MSSLNIPFKSPLHKRIVEAVCDRIKVSRDKMSQRYEQFRKSEDLFLAYLPESEADKLRRQKRESQGLQTYTTIEVPYSYATLMAAHMYWTSVFLSRSPIHQYTGRHGEAEHKVQGLESLIDYQVQVGGMMVPYYIWLLDAGKYGLGVIGTYWADEYEVISSIEEQPATFNGVPLVGVEPEKVRVTRRVSTYKGNRVYNIRPQDFLPDPRVPITRFQDGEFAGRRTDVSWNYLRKQEASGRYFNLDAVKAMKNTGTEKREQGSSQNVLPDTSVNANSANIKEMSTVELHEMVIELVPDDWGLGSGKYPEKWVFTVAGEKVLIGCEPLGNLHNKFPYDIMEYEVEGYSVFKRSMLEVIEPMNKIISWLFNAHFYNVRKVLNDQFVVDPSRITMKDITDPNAGKVIRVKPAAYGQDVRTMVTQLQVTDVTRAHIQDIGLVEQLVQRISGVVDSVMGVPKQGGRQTATEVRTTSGFSINRLKTNAEYMSALGFAPHSMKLVQNTLQFYDQEQVFRIAGALPMGMNPYMMISPEMIAGAYDFVPVDGTMPVDKFALASVWTELLKEMQAFPEIMQRYDMAQIFSYVAQLGGIKNIKQFEIKLVPDQILAQQAQAGNVIPLGNKSPGGSGRSGGGNSGRIAGAGVGPATASQIPGMGPAG